MGFAVELWKLNKRDNSTMIPTADPITYQCVTNTDFDVLSPEIPLNIGLVENPTSYNYAHIAVFSRYYWVTGWHVANGMWWVSLQVDVLASWRDDIGAATLYVDRSASDYSGDIVDTTYPALADFTVTTAPFTLTDGDGHRWSTTGGYTDGTFVVGIIGTGGAVTYWAFPYPNYISFMSEIFNADYGFTDEQVKAVFNPIQYITSVVWVPFAYAGSGTIAVTMGWWTIDTATGYKLGAGAWVTFDASVNLPKHPQQSRGVWLNGPSHTKYLLKLPCYGMLDIQGFDMVDSTSINITVSVDLSTGKALLRLQPSSVNADTQIVEYQAGVSVQVSQIQSTLLSQGVNKLRDMGPIGRYMATNLTAGQGAVSSLLGSITNIADFDFSDKVSSSGTTGAIVDTLITGAIIGVFQHVADENLPDRGRPLCARKKISALSGYIQISDADISVPCTSPELSRIKSYLQGGFFYE